MSYDNHDWPKLHRVQRVPHNEALYEPTEVDAQVTRHCLPSLVDICTYVSPASALSIRRLFGDTRRECLRRGDCHRQQQQVHSATRRSEREQRCVLRVIWSAEGVVKRQFTYDEEVNDVRRCANVVAVEATCVSGEVGLHAESLSLHVLAVASLLLHPQRRRLRLSSLRRR